MLSAPSIWQRPDGLRTTIRILSIFNSAAIHLVQSEDSPEANSHFLTQRGLEREEWAIAVVKGADNRSPRWRHLCVLAGLLVGFEGRGKQSVSATLRRKLENATVKAVNLALREGEASSELAGNSICMMLSHVFDLLRVSERANLNNDLLLPILIHAPFFSKEGLQHGYFLSTIDSDIVQIGGMTFDWSPKSSTYVQCQRMAIGPLISSLGALSRLTAFCVENVPNADLLSAMITDLSAFTRSLFVQWRQNKLSEIDITEESIHLTEKSLNATIPLLWRVLKSTMFAVIIVLRSLLGRVLGEDLMPAHSCKSPALMRLFSSLTTYSSTHSDSNAPNTARSILHLFATWIKRLFAIHLRVPFCHRHPVSISSASRGLPSGNTTIICRQHTTAPSRALSGSLLPEHDRTLYYSA